MRAATLETWIWVLIYAGLLAVGLGLALQRQGDAALGWTLVVAGGIVAALGVLLIWVRSRMKDDRG